MCARWGGYAQETVTDELTATTLNVSTKSYQKFATKTLSSGASYDGAAFIDNNNPKGIQIRSKVDKGLYTGIITSASGGTIKSITINFNSNNSNALGIYGKNTAYTTADDLFGSAAGELIKNVSNSKTAVTITPNKAYKFIGFKSNKGTIYIDKITIVWEKAATTPTTTTTFGANSGKTFTFTNGTLEGFTTPTATAKKSDDNTDLSNLIEYTSSDADIVAVDSKTGELTFTNTKFGKATITATLPKTDTYQTSTDSYFVENKDNHTATSLSFNGTDVTLTEGKTDAGADFTGYTATEANNIAGTITYAASGDAVATVNSTTGAVTVSPSVYGTTTITATFTPTDPTQYSGSTAKYQITNKKAVDLSEIVFDVSEDKVSGTSKLTLTKSIVKINTSSGALGDATDYRFYSRSKTTFSLTDPTRVITSIKFISSNTTYKNFTTNKPNYDKTTGTWTGHEESVVFTASSQVNSVTQIIVTTKLDPALSFAEATVTKELVAGTIDLQTITKPEDLDAAANDTYKETTATCTLKVINSAMEETSIEFVAGVDKGKNSTSTTGDAVEKGCVMISSDKAALGRDADYRFYSSTHTISTRIGKITKIEFVGNNIINDKISNPLTNLTSADNNYTCTDPNNGVWVGSAKEVVFTNSSQARATKIIVTVEVPKAKSYTLDETKTDNVIETYENANVTLQRTLSKDYWNTFCVPFALDAKQVTQYFGEGTQLRTYEGRCENNIVYFATVDNIEAGKPYIMKPGNAVVKNPTFEGVSMVATGLDENGNPQAVGATTTVQMKGIYNQVLLRTDRTELFLGDNDLFYYPINNTESRTIGGLRAYFIVPQGTDIKKLRANLDGTPTSLGTIFDTEESNAPVYNLQGQCVGNSLRALKSGIYIQNGKKVAVK